MVVQFGGRVKGWSGGAFMCVGRVKIKNRRKGMVYFDT